MLVAERECSCGAEIAFALTERGSKMPLDIAPDPAGRIVLRGKAGMAPVAHVLGRNEQPAPGEQRFRTHFGTCPDARTFRRS